jgi:hypothetical protein
MCWTGIQKEVKPTDIEKEGEKGRIALWLDLVDLEWLSLHCCCADDASQEQKDCCARLRFRSSAALHKKVILP